MYNWQKFTPTNKRIERRISITKSEAIGFPTQNYLDNNIKSYKYIVLYFDREQMALGIQLTNNEEEKDKLRIVHSSKGYGAQVLAHNFFKLYDIDAKRYTGKYEYEKIADDNIGEIIVVKLKDKENTNVET